MSLSASYSDQVRMIFRGCFLAGAIGLLAGCATQTFPVESAPEFIVTREYTPFYLVGPMQVNGPDGSLPTNTRVKVLKKEMGYDLVLLDDKRTGYVAEENLAPAPPLPPPSTDTASNSSGGKKRRGAGTGPKYTGEQLNDVPLPDPNVPPPDLNVAPEEVPFSTPTPAQEKPKFRY